VKVSIPAVKKEYNYWWVSSFLSGIFR